MADDQKSDREPFWFPFRQQTGSLLASYQTKKTGTRAEVREGCGKLLYKEICNILLLSHILTLRNQLSPSRRLVPLSLQKGVMFCILFYVPTRRYLLSSRQTAVAVCKLSDSSDDQTGSLLGFLSD